MRQKGNEGRQNIQKKAVKVAKKQAGRPFEWTQGHQGKLLQNRRRRGGDSGSGKANMKMADEGGLGVSVAQIGWLGSFFDAPDELHVESFYRNMCLCIFEQPSNELVAFWTPSGVQKGDKSWAPKCNFRKAAGGKKCSHSRTGAAFLQFEWVSKV